MSVQAIQLPDDVVAGCKQALAEYLQREPTADELGRGLAEMAKDVLEGRMSEPTAERYAAWLHRVVGSVRRVRTDQRTTDGEPLDACCGYLLRATQPCPFCRRTTSGELL